MDLLAVRSSWCTSYKSLPFGGSAINVCQDLQCSSIDAAVQSSPSNTRGWSISAASRCLQRRSAFGQPASFLRLQLKGVRLSRGSFVGCHLHSPPTQTRKHDKHRERKGARVSSEFWYEEEVEFDVNEIVRPKRIVLMRCAEHHIKR
jgi:hypothetical protein